jgi:hypothetical protein
MDQETTAVADTRIPPGGWPAQEPRPGAIPLRPLDLGDLLSGSFAVLGRSWKQLIGLVFAVSLLAVALIFLAVWIAYSALRDDVRRLDSLPGAPSFEEVFPVLAGFGSVVVMMLALMLVLQALVSALCQIAVQDAVLGRRTGVGALWGRAWARFPSVLGTLLVSAVLLIVPAVLFLGSMISLAFWVDDSESGGAAFFGIFVVASLVLLPAVTWLWVKFSLAAPAAVLERQGPVGALRRSWRLVRGSWWRVFGITALAAVMAGMLSYAAQMPLSMVSAIPGVVDVEAMENSDSASEALESMAVVLVVMVIGQLVGQIIGMVFPQLVAGLLYVDRRIRTENLAPALAAAAAAEGPVVLEKQTDGTGPAGP